MSIITKDGRHAKVTKTDFSKALSSFVDNLYGENETMLLKDLIEEKKKVRDDIYTFEVGKVLPSLTLFL